MIIGIDLDNTIIDYRGVFHRHAVRRGLIPPSVPPGKDDVRDYLRAIGREDDFTELQGFVYGPGLAEAKPFEGVHEALGALQRAGHRPIIISHKTPRPFLGPPYDLQAFAREWLRSQGLVGEPHGILAPNDLFLEPTKAAKQARIAELGCEWFIDDLPEFLEDAAFPPSVRRILFDPEGKSRPDPRWRSARSWSEISSIILES
ncbi:MAG: hypothetical protein NZ740_06220 [Kiritimatiellae bacterium]|nr:hypothetical protein [Kiritimatiellia bacterium]MDW8458690.1 hypothetical protein [Verrucomicrobiota bacterium]